MKDNTHPKYHAQAQVICTGCGNTFTTGSVLPEIRVAVCSNCHPFFTGKQKFVDSEGRVERFRKKYAMKTTAPKSPAAAAEAPEKAPE